MTNARPLPPTHREAIREIFLRRRSEYTTWEAAGLLRLGLGELLAWIESGVLHADVKRKNRQLGGPRHALISWSELASAAMLRWNVMQVHDALGEHANRVLPRLLRPVVMQTIRLPEYQVRLIEAFSKQQGVSIEDYVYTALLSLEVMGDADEVETLLPGFKEAMRFP